MKLAYDAATKKDYDKAEVLAMDAARDGGEFGYDANVYLVNFYSHKKPDKAKQLHWMIKQTEHPLYKKKDEGFLLETQIGDRYRLGEGSPPDLPIACNWYLRAYNHTQENIEWERDNMYLLSHEARLREALVIHMGALTPACDSIPDEQIRKAVAQSKQGLEAAKQRADRRALRDVEEAQKQAEWDRKREEERRARQSRD
jgi:hypothetical protein